jgi:hypothetical protein
LNTTYVIVAVVLVVLILSAVLLPMMARRKRSDRFKGQFGSEYDHTVQVFGDDKKAQTELEKRQKYVDALDIRPLTVNEHKRYLADWVAVQSDFVDEPGHHRGRSPHHAAACLSHI